MRGGVSSMSSTCVQGDHPRPLGGYQPNLIVEPHSAASAWNQAQHPVVPKQEAMDEDRNDSGLASDSHSASSPGSENSHDNNNVKHLSVLQQSSGYYNNSPLTLSRLPSSPPLENSSYYNNSPLKLSRLPPSPPLGYRPIHLPYQQSMPSTSKQEDGNEDPLRRLQIALDTKQLVPQSQSPKTSDDDKSDIEGETNEQELRIPRINSHGKVKKFRCKQCDFVAITKLAFWKHSKAHIKAEKRLICPRCPFVTEYKHHLEYHLRNHIGSKPFRCSKCSYSCVNKSMLNSHMKSHSNVYQYRCSDCTYATKYCHSLKLHLRKYGHNPAMVLNTDGSPNPLPIIDVYGTRRGPKQKTMRRISQGNSSNLPDLQQSFPGFYLGNSEPLAVQQLAYQFQFLGSLPNPLLFPHPTVVQDGSHPHQQEMQPETSAASEKVLDLSKPSSPVEAPSKNRRKGPAFKLNHFRVNESSEEEELDTDEEMEKLQPNKTEETHNNNNNNNNNDNNASMQPENHSCKFCNITFGDIIMYNLHQGYHNHKDPFSCNMCGEQCKDRVSFFSHIARNPHK